MSRKVIKYLEKKNKAEYLALDKIFEIYLDGNLEKILSKYGFSEIEIFPSISQNDASIQIYFRYSCLRAILEFKKSYFEYCKYLPGCSADELDASIIKEYYSEGFAFEHFVERLSKELKEDEEISSCRNLRKKQKIYSIIAEISLNIPCIFFGILALYVIIFNKTIELSPWFLLVIIVPLIIWFIFDVKSKRNN